MYDKNWKNVSYLQNIPRKNVFEVLPEQENEINAMNNITINFL